MSTSPNESERNGIEGEGSTPESEVSLGNDGNLIENITPETGIFEVVTTKPTHDQKTRRFIALIIIWALVGSHALGFMAYVFGLLDTEKFTIFVTGFSGLQALAAAAVGFYYGSNNDSK